MLTDSMISLIMSGAAVTLLVISVIIALKSETGQNKAQTICLWLGEALAIMNLLFIIL